MLAARGLSYSRIGEELVISESTVKRHLANIYEKVGVRSRDDAVRTALMEEWIDLHEITSADGAAPTAREARAPSGAHPGGSMRAIHRSAWKAKSPKSASRIPHGPGPTTGSKASYRRANRYLPSYILWRRIKVRPGVYGNPEGAG